MKKQLKSFAFAVLAGAVITVMCGFCLNQSRGSKQLYTRNGKIRSQGAIDTIKSPQDVFIMSLTKWCLMQTKRMKQA
ncbi:MAG: hypothetical protein ACLR5N_05145 [Haemophilus parainfluenzae]